MKKLRRPPGAPEVLVQLLAEEAERSIATLCAADGSIIAVGRDVREIAGQDLRTAHVAATAAVPPGLVVLALDRCRGSNTQPLFDTVRIQCLRSGPSALRSIHIVWVGLASSTITPDQTDANSDERLCSTPGAAMNTSSRSNTRCGSSTSASAQRMRLRGMSTTRSSIFSRRTSDGQRVFIAFESFPLVRGILSVPGAGCPHSETATAPTSGAPSIGRYWPANDASLLPASWANRSFS